MRLRQLQLLTDKSLIAQLQMRRRLQAATINHGARSQLRAAGKRHVGGGNLADRACGTQIVTADRRQMPGEVSRGD